MSVMVSFDAAPTRRTLIPRMPGRGDLVVIVERDEVLLRADQVEQLAGIPPWSGDTLIDDHWTVVDGVQFYPLEDAIARAESASTPTAAAFLVWIRPTIDELLVDDVLDAAQRITPFIGSCSVRKASTLLDADPAISIGQRTLFLHMQQQGWIVREGDAWQVTLLARRNGWLTTRTLKVPARQRPYVQVFVTPQGLTELRTTLHALYRSAPQLPATPALFDLNAPVPAAGHTARGGAA